MRTRQAWCVIALVSLGSSVIPASGAPLFSVIIQRDTVYKQTGPSAPTSPSGLDIFLKGDPPGPFDGGTVNTPGTAGTVTLTPGTDGAGNPDIQFGSGLLTNQASFNAMFPTGTYTFNLTDSADATQNTSQSIIDNSSGTFPPIPALTAASFNGLQGLDPTQAFTVFFNQFDSTNGPGELGFFFIVDKNTFATVFFDAPQPTTTQENIPANTLLAGKQYLFALFFTTNTAGGGTASNTELQVNSETQGLFTTAGAVPEPGTACLCLLGLGVFAAANRKRRGRVDSRP